MVTLLVKELRQLYPIAFLWMALLALSVGFELFTARIDEQTYELFCDALCSTGIEYFQASFLMILCLVTAYSLYPREVDERTLDFLHALPIKKSSIFYAKFAAAFLLICLLLLIGYGVNQLVLAFNPESMSGKKYWLIDGSLFLRDCIFAFVVLAHGVFLSRFRTAGLIMYAFYLMLVRWLETLFDGIEWVSVYELFNIEYAGERFSFSYDAMVLHVAVALLLLILANKLWSNAKGKAIGPSKSNRFHKGLKIGGSIVGFLLVSLSLVGQVMQNNQPIAGAETAQLQTDHYRFVFLSFDRSRAEQLHSVAEGHYQRARELLNASQEPVIHVDMTAENEHAAGLAQWKTIKMGLSGADSPQRYARVLSHETAHVFQSVESNRAFRNYFNATRFFIEGMANYVSFEIVPQSDARDQNRDIAAVSWKRQTIRFENMINGAAFTAQFNAELVYSLGEIWTQALVDVCGIEAVGGVLRAAGRDGAPKDLTAMAFWRDTLQSINCELEVVNGAWRQRLQKRFDQIDQKRFPIVSNVVAKQANNTITITAEVPGGSEFPASWFALRIAAADKTVASVDSFFRAELLEDVGDVARVSFSLPEGLFDERRFRYQIGYQVASDSRIYFQPWRSGSTVQ